MQSQVLWAIDEELGGAKFERLCVDLLYRTYLVFVTSRRVRGMDIDQLRTEFRKKYGFWSSIRGNGFASSLKRPILI
jgi:hypothetical protein